MDNLSTITKYICNEPSDALSRNSLRQTFYQALFSVIVTINNATFPADLI